MRRLLSFAILTLALAAIAQAQYRPSGPPASVTSANPNSPIGGASGPGATVTSGSFSPRVAQPFHAPRRHRDHNGGFGRGGGRFGNDFAPAWTYSPMLVPVPVPVDANGNPIEMTDQEAATADGEEDAPAYTVFERRNRSAVPMYDYDMHRGSGMPQMRQSDAEARPAPAVPDQPATVLVFRDGHQLEITNYAIQSGTLFNLSDNGPRKIALADLDVDKTMKANDQRGVDFTLPTAR